MARKQRATHPDRREVLIAAAVLLAGASVPLLRPRPATSGLRPIGGGLFLDELGAIRTGTERIPAR
jgi:hypothetical protein